MRCTNSRGLRWPLFLAVLMLAIGLASAASAAVEITNFGPLTFVRNTGRYVRNPGTPTIHSTSFPAVAGAGTLHIQNAGVSSAAIYLNGLEIVSPRAFSRRTGSFAVPVGLKMANRIKVELRSAPGTSLQLWMTQTLESAAASVVGPAGGTVVVNEPGGPLEGVTVEFPPGALPSPAVVRVSEYDRNGVPALPDDYLPVSVGVEIESTFSKLSAPARIVIPYPDDDGDGIVDGTLIPEGDLGVLCSNDDFASHEHLDSTVDEQANTVTVETVHFTSFNIFSQRWPAPSTITYSIDNTPSRTAASPDDIRSAVRAAFNEWDQELTRVGITFAEIEPGDSPDIRVLWTSRDVGGLGLTTGYFSGLSVHKKIELADDLAACCDGDDDWSAAQAPEFSIDHYYVKFIVLHELGHALGLDHLTRAEQQLPGANLAVMQPKGGQNNLPLSYIDIAKVKRRYGIPDLPSGRLLLYHMDSYHFAAGRMYSLSMGDFYFIFWPIDMVTSQPTPDAEPSFWANNGTTKGTLQAGLVDLGDIGDAPLTSVILPNYQSCGIMYSSYPNPESPCYFPYGVPAVIGHTYVSPAQESGHFIVFRVLSVAHNEYVEIAYQQR